MMAAVLANADQLYVAPGGPLYHYTKRISTDAHGNVSIARRIGFLLLLTWVPMCVFALLQGIAMGDTPRGSFLLDFSTYARFFVALPVLVIAEVTIGPRLRAAGLKFVEDGLVHQKDMPAFEQAVARLARRRESMLVTFVTIGLAFFGAWQLTYESASGVAVGGWQSIELPAGHVLRYSLAGLWSHFVALPVLLFFLYRWLWRLFFWSLFLLDVARLDLQLLPTHADMSGGIGFLEIAHMSFSSIAFAATSVLSAEVAFRVIYEGAPINSFQLPVAIVFGVVLVLFLGPLLFFCPVMARSWRAANNEYSSLSVRYSRAFQRRWIGGDPAPDEPLLGTGDIQSLADLGNSFRVVYDMRFVPFGKYVLIQLAVVTVLPCLPLILLVVPMSEIASVLAKIVL